MLLSSSYTAHAEDPLSAETLQLLASDVEDLVGLKVNVSEFKKEEFSSGKQFNRVSQTPAAVYVLSSEDIRNSGVNSIAEALRLVPGVFVGRAGSSNWSVSIRSAPRNQFTDSLLVLVDGRSIYNSVHSGVYWDLQDMILEDIARIEIIRGPGGTIWGNNAVSGVINVITKKARSTQGALVSTTAGTIEQPAVSTRYGGKISDDTYYRLYARHVSRNDAELLDGTGANDDGKAFSAGIRVDSTLSEIDDISFDAKAYYVKNDFMHITAFDEDGNPLLGTFTGIPPFFFSGPFYDIRPDEEQTKGGHAMVKWQREWNKNSVTTLKTYVDLIRRDDVYSDMGNYIYDVDFQHLWNVNSTHEVTWGLGFRFSEYHLNDTFYTTYVKNKHYSAVSSAFIQDKITLMPDHLYLTIGSKFEHNDFSGEEHQPSVRLTWTPTHNQTVWAAATQAIQNPGSIFTKEVYESSNFTRPSPPAPGGINIGLSDDLKVAKYRSYELGYRIYPSNDLSFDLATFYNDNEHISGVYFDPFPDVSLDYKTSGDSFGIELSVKWAANDDWDMIFNYSHLNSNINVDDAESWPIPAENKLNIQSTYRFLDALDMTNTLYFIDDLPTEGIESHVRFDTRIGWHVNDGLELNIVGQNIFKKRQHETRAFFHEQPGVATPRSFYANVRWIF